MRFCVSEPRIVKIKFAIYLRNTGDGGVSASFYANTKLAEEAAEKDDERFGDDIQKHSIVVNLDTGEVVSGIMNKVRRS